MPTEQRIEYIDMKQKIHRLVENSLQHFHKEFIQADTASPKDIWKCPIPLQVANVSMNTVYTRYCVAYKIGVSVVNMFIHPSVSLLRLITPLIPPSTV